MNILEALRQTTISIKTWAESKFLNKNDLDYPVNSVNGKTGTVELNATDVGALSSDTEIPSITGLATEDYVDSAVSQKSQVQMITVDTSEILSTLKIHKLTQDEYNQKVNDETLDENTLYLTPDEEIPALPTVTTADNGKILMVVDGEWTVVDINLTVDANGVLSV